MPTAPRLKYCAPLLLLLTAASDGSGDLRYTAVGALVVPAYREWVFMSSGIDMSYSEKPAMEGESMFDNVFVDPKAWASFNVHRVLSAGETNRREGRQLPHGMRSARTTALREL